jgi:hypothetical protein
VRFRFVAAHDEIPKIMLCETLTVRANSRIGLPTAHGRTIEPPKIPIFRAILLI